jgi:hypothetical protein
MNNSKEITTAISNPTAKESEPVLALTVYCMAEQQQIISKLKDALEYITSLTPNEFENRHEKDGVIIKIFKLK